MYETYGTDEDRLQKCSWQVRRINEEGIALVKEFEGLRLKAYQCPGRVWTIGYGHTDTAHAGLCITLCEAEELLSEDLKRVQIEVAKCLNVPLNDNQFSALVCFAFNVGVSNFAHSTLLKLLNRGWYEQVPAQLARWNKIHGEVFGGLARRRAAEARLWNKPVKFGGDENDI